MADVDRPGTVTRVQRPSRSAHGDLVVFLVLVAASLGTAIAVASLSTIAT